MQHLWPLSQYTHPTPPHPSPPLPHPTLPTPPTRVAVVHKADALDRPPLLKLAAQLALRHVVRQAGHKQGLEGVALRRVPRAGQGGAGRQARWRVSPPAGRPRRGEIPPTPLQRHSVSPSSHTSTLGSFAGSHPFSASCRADAVASSRSCRSRTSLRARGRRVGRVGRPHPHGRRRRWRHTQQHAGPCSTQSRRHRPTHFSTLLSMSTRACVASSGLRKMRGLGGRVSGGGGSYSASSGSAKCCTYLGSEQKDKGEGGRAGQARAGVRHGQRVEHSSRYGNRCARPCGAAARPLQSNGNKGSSAAPAPAAPKLTVRRPCTAAWAAAWSESCAVAAARAAQTFAAAPAAGRCGGPPPPPASASSHRCAGRGSCDPCERGGGEVSGGERQAAGAAGLRCRRPLGGLAHNSRCRELGSAGAPGGPGGRGKVVPAIGGPQGLAAAIARALRKLKARSVPPAPCPRHRRTPAEGLAARPLCSS